MLARGSFLLIRACGCPRDTGYIREVGGQCLENLGSGVNGRLCDLGLCSENLGEEETYELESGGKEGPVAPQRARRAMEGSVRDSENFLGLEKQIRPFFGTALGALTSLVSFVSQRKPVPACSPWQGWRMFPVKDQELNIS